MDSAHGQWEIQDSHTLANLHGIHSVGGGTAWASGSGATVLRTTDDGAHWLACPIPPGAAGLDFRAIQAFDRNSAVVMSTGNGSVSRLYKTNDACHTWKLIFTNPDPGGSFDALQFTSRDYLQLHGKLFGILLGGPVAGRFPLFLSFDSGETWERQTTSPEALPGETVFPASNSILRLGDLADRTFITGGLSGARMLLFMSYLDNITPDGHKPCGHPVCQINEWIPWAIPVAHPAPTAGAYSWGWAEGHGAVLVGGDPEHPNRTADTGWYPNLSFNGSRFSFKTALTPPRGFRSAVAFDTATKTWITVGPNGTDISKDYGRNWRPLHPNPKAGDAPDADRNWNALSLPFVAGPNGRIGKLRTHVLKQ